MSIAVIRCSVTVHCEHHVNVSTSQTASQSTLAATTVSFANLHGQISSFTQQAVAFDCQPGARAVRGSWLNALAPAPRNPWQRREKEKEGNGREGDWEEGKKEEEKKTLSPHKTVP